MDQWEGQSWTRFARKPVRRPGRHPHRPVESRADSARGRQGHPAGGRAGRHRVRPAHQDPERHPHALVGASDLHRRDGARAEGLRRAPGREVPGRLFAGTLLARRARRLRSRPGIHRLVAGRRHAAHALRDASAPVAVLRRLVRRELREQRTVRRRHHAGTGSGRGTPVSRDRRAVGAHAHGRLDRRLDCDGAPDLLSGLLRRHVRPLSRFGGFPLPPDREHLRGRERLLDRPRLDEDRTPEPAPA